VARRSKVVLDSSIIVKWFTKEEGSLLALELLDSFINGYLTILESELIFYEVANALRCNPDFSSEDLNRLHLSPIRTGIPNRKFDDVLLRETARIAFGGGVTFYDAIPVGIAKIEKVNCITADKKTQFTPLSQKGYPIRLLN
jgi:predicted nucleic acid-binding protein